jgi:hypothetical protein
MYDNTSATALLGLIQATKCGRVVEILIVVFSFQVREVLSDDNRYYAWESNHRSDPLTAEWQWTLYGGRDGFYQRMSHVLFVQVNIVAWNAFQMLLKCSPVYVGMVAEMIGHEPTLQELEHYYSDKDGHGFAEPLRLSFAPFRIV